MNSNFKPEEIVKFERYNKKLGKNVETSFPIVGGRLRLFHEDLSKADSSEIAGGIDIEIIDRDREYALVKARVCINGNAFTGIGMASKSRDSMIFPAIMEMAETRAIARALRFAGYGVEYTGAEEMQGIKKFDETSEEPSDIETTQDVNDDMSTNKPQPETSEGPSTKRQVWELVTSLHPGIQENYLADAVFKFVEATVAKYEDGNVGNVYAMILENRDRFAAAFVKFVDEAQPEIKAPGVDPEPTIEPEEKKEYQENKQTAAENLKIDPPSPTVDKDKVAKANIYRSMPDGISVAALNGTLKHLITENTDYEAGAIYEMVLGDIDGFMVMLKNWCANNDVPSGIEPKTGAPLKLKIDPDPSDVSKTLTGKEFRKSWVRLDMENFNKFIIQNSDTFKSDKEEYDLAVAKYDRLKAKSKDTENLVFPYLFSQADVERTESKPQLSTENSILEEAGNAGGDKEVNIMKKYIPMFPALSKKISEAMGIDLGTDIDTEALKFNEKIEELLTNYETEHKKAYTEE